MRKSAPLFCALLLSLSARRAWIEILWRLVVPQVPDVALRKESVDRNIRVCIRCHKFAQSLSARRAWIEIGDYVQYSYNDKSLSARRAWIEIVYPGTWSGSILVALRKESVDRNFNAVQIVVVIVCRSPQGERG